MIRVLRVVFGLSSVVVGILMVLDTAGGVSRLLASLSLFVMGAYLIHFGITGRTRFWRRRDIPSGR